MSAKKRRENRIFDPVLIQLGHKPGFTVRNLLSDQGIHKRKIVGVGAARYPDVSTPVQYRVLWHVIAVSELAAGRQSRPTSRQAHTDQADCPARVLEESVTTPVGRKLLAVPITIAPPSGSGKAL